MSPFMADTVEKLGPTAGRRKIRISSGVLANHCFALGRVRESSLRRPGAKIVFQQHRPFCDTAKDATEFGFKPES
jgi:hypothetical protein